MKCTECSKRSDHLHGERWSSRYGWIIQKYEQICDDCALKRKGFTTSGVLLKNKEKSLIRCLKQC